MAISCSRRLHFSAGHRLLDHEGACAHLHGHNYVVWLKAEPVEGAGVDGIGRVVDFSVLKERVGTWIDRYWDHGFIVHEKDRVVRRLLAEAGEELEHGQKVFALPFNPTAENLARYLLEVICPAVLVGTGARVTAVCVEETENCNAEACL